MTCIQLPLPNFDNGLSRLLASLCYDDALVVDGYRVEYRKFTGSPQLRVYRRKRLLWTAKVVKSRLAEVFYAVGFYLAQRGCEARYARKVVFGAVA